MRVSLRDDGFLSQLKCMEESHQEATEKEVERILGLLQTYFREDREYGTTLKGAAAVVSGVPLSARLFYLKGIPVAYI